MPYSLHAKKYDKARDICQARVADDADVVDDEVKAPVPAAYLFCAAPAFAPASRVVLRDRAGRTVATASVPPLKAPSGLMPKTADAALDLPANADWHGGTVTVEMTGADPEITLRNNRVEM